MKKLLVLGALALVPFALVGCGKEPLPDDLDITVEAITGDEYGEIQEIQFFEENVPAVDDILPELSGETTDQEDVVLSVNPDEEVLVVPEEEVSLPEVVVVE
jgi:hypothetical protein